MRTDFYLRAVLTIIAGALVYLCIVLTPMPGASAQQPARGALRPGDDTGPAEMVIVGVRLPAGATVPVAGDVQVLNELRVTGRVQTEQRPNVVERVVLTGWEEDSSPRNPAAVRAFRAFRQPAPSRPGSGLPVTTQ